MKKYSYNLNYGDFMQVGINEKFANLFGNKLS